MAQKVCSTCGFVGYAKFITKGSIFLEIFLWCMLIFPGLLYSLWRLTTRTRNGCPKCGNTTMIPVNSPIGQNLVKSLYHESPEPPRTESVAYKLGAKIGSKGGKSHETKSNDDFIFEEIPEQEAEPEKLTIKSFPDDPSRPDVKKAQCCACDKIVTYQKKMIGRNVNCPECKQAFVLP